jgi:succinate dehydrogenase/fumarate reductase flavoprotein subunit
MDKLMVKSSYVNQVIETDVLIIGGGAAGCFAAFGANDLGVDVTIVEKADIRRSGSLATGVDDARFAHPEITIPAEDFARSIVEPMEGMVDPKLAYIIANESYQRVLDLEKMGVKMRDDDGTFRRIPNRHPAAFWFRGADLKLRMTGEIRYRKIAVLQRTMTVQLLTQGNRTAGALCLDVRTGSFLIIMAKAIIIATGGALRLHVARGNPFMTHHCPANAGDGIGMAYSAGAELTGLEFSSVAIGPRNPRIFPALGAVFDANVPVVNAEGEAVVKNPIGGGDLSQTFLQEIAAGRGPLYWDFPAISKEARAQFTEAALNERPIVLKYLQEEGIDLANDRIEIAGLYQEGIAIHQGGIIINDSCRTSVEGLYAAGDDVAMLGARGNSALGAMILGHRAGRFAAEFARRIEHAELNLGQAEEEAKSIVASITRNEGIEPIVLEERVREMVSSYCGIEKTRERIQTGLDLLQEMKREYVNRVLAETPHHLMRYIELGNILNIAEMHLRASLMRTESRLGLSHRRIDYPNRDDRQWRKMIVVRKHEDDNMSLEIRPLPWDGKQR